MYDISTKNIVVNGLDICYYCCGEGNPTIVLVHGAGADSAMLSWREVLPLLAQRGFRVIAPDLPGYGASARYDGSHSLPFYSNFIRSFIKELQLENVVLGGLSLGGGITLKVALEETSLLSAIIPVDAWGLSNRLPWHRLTYWYVNSSLNAKVFPWTARHRWMIRWSLENSLFGDKSKVTERLVDDVAVAMSAPDIGEPFRSFQLAEITPKGLVTSLFDYLDTIILPTLLVHGSDDGAVPLKDALAAQKKIPNSQLYIMEGCKHWPQKERPEDFTEAVDAFVRQL